MGTRPPLRGYNHNIRYRDRVYHVQTEDSGLENPHVFTHMFLEGQIIASRRLDYDDLVVESEEQQKENDQKIRKRMQDQHKSLMKQLRRGEMDETIIALMGMLEPVVDELSVGEEPAVAEVPAGMGPSLAPVATEETPAAAMPDQAPEVGVAPPTLKEEGPSTLKESPPGKVEEPPPFAAEVAAAVAESPPPLAVEVVPSTAVPVPPVAVSAPPTAVPAPPPRPSRVSRPRPVVPEPELSRPINVRGLAKPTGMPDVEVTQPVDVRALHGFDRPAADTERPLFPEDAREVEVPVIVDGPPPQESTAGPLPASTYSHVYREDEPRRIETPVRHRISTPLPQPPPIRRQSRVFGQPLPGSTRYPSSDELPSVGALPRKSGVYLVPGGPPQRPPHPDPAVRRQVRPQEPRVRASSPQRYTAPRRPPSQIPKPVPRRQTGAYEKPTSEETPQRAKIDPKRGSSPPIRPPVIPPPRPVTAPAMVQSRSGTAPEQRQAQPSVSQSSPRLQQPTTLPRTGSPSQPHPRMASPFQPHRVAPPSQPHARAISPTERPPRPPSTPPQHVVARPVVVVGQPIKRPPRVPSPPVVTPPSVPRARPASKPFARGAAKESFSGAQESSISVELASVFGSDLISERSLDEVILAYLAEDNEGEE